MRDELIKELGLEANKQKAEFFIQKEKLLIKRKRKTNEYTIFTGKIR